MSVRRFFRAGKGAEQRRTSAGKRDILKIKNSPTDLKSIPTMCRGKKRTGTQAKSINCACGMPPPLVAREQGLCLASKSEENAKEKKGDYWGRHSRGIKEGSILWRKKVLLAGEKGLGLRRKGGERAH